MVAHRINNLARFQRADFARKTTIARMERVHAKRQYIPPTLFAASQMKKIDTPSPLDSCVRICLMERTVRVSNRFAQVVIAMMMACVLRSLNQIQISLTLPPILPKNLFRFRVLLIQPKHLLQMQAVRCLLCSSLARQHLLQLQYQYPSRLSATQ